MRARIAHHITDCTLLPELSELLLHMVTHDLEQCSYRQEWTAAILALQQALGAPHSAVLPFVDAWLIMYAAISRLDHLQDNDPVSDTRMNDLPSAQHYNAVFGYYVLSESVLSTLDPTITPASRINRLRAFWSSSLLRMASGQQRDLLMSTSDLTHAAVSTYQDIAQWKTGATFSLAFGGAALLHTDDQAIIDALMLAGEFYGTLLQYADDLSDRKQQPNTTLTLPTALARLSLVATPDHPTALWLAIYQTYMAQLTPVLQALPESVRDIITTLFVDTFHIASASGTLS